MPHSPKHPSSEPPIRVDLPGKVAYGGTPCYLTPLTFYDVKRVTNAMKTVDQELLAEVAKDRCSIPPEQLLYQDFVFVLYWLRLQSFPHYRVEYTWTCSKCGEKTVSPAEATNYDELREEYRPDGVPLRMHSSGEEVRFRLSTLEDTLILGRNIEGKMDPAENEMIRIALMMEPDGGTLEERMEKVRTFSSDDAFLISHFERDFAFGVSRTQEVTCSNTKCAIEQVIRNDFSISRFLPEDQRPTTVPDRVSDGEPVQPEPGRPGEPGLHEAGGTPADETPGAQEAEGRARPGKK